MSKAEPTTPPRPRGRPRAPDWDEKRAKILTIAAGLFSDKGFNKTSFASVAEAVGMTLPGLTHHFPSKISLLLEVLNHRDAEPFVTETETGTRDIFEELKLRMERDTGRGAELTRLFIVLSTEALSQSHPAHEWFQRRIARVTENVVGALEGMKAKGHLRHDMDSMAEATALLAMMDGLQTRWLGTPDAVDPVSIFTRYLEAVKARLQA